MTDTFVSDRAEGVIFKNNAAQVVFTNFILAFENVMWFFWCSFNEITVNSQYLIYCIHYFCNQITVILLHVMHSFLTYWIERIDISRGSAECCLKASRFHSGYFVGAGVDCKEQCGFVATSHTFIPGQRKGIKWKRCSLFVVIPSVRSHMNMLLELEPLRRSPTEFLSPLLTFPWTLWIICTSLHHPNLLWRTLQPQIHTLFHPLLSHDLTATGL